MNIDISSLQHFANPLANKQHEERLYEESAT
jgi:hypothetical protein